MSDTRVTRTNNVDSDDGHRAEAGATQTAQEGWQKGRKEGLLMFPRYTFGDGDTGIYRVNGRCYLCVLGRGVCRVPVFMWRLTGYKWGRL